MGVGLGLRWLARCVCGAMQRLKMHMLVLSLGARPGDCLRVGTMTQPPKDADRPAPHPRPESDGPLTPLRKMCEMCRTAI